MTNKRANKLITDGELFEEHNPERAKELYKQFINQASYVEVPGCRGHYRCHNLVHADTRKLFLMYLGVSAAGGTDQ